MDDARARSNTYPSLAQIAGHALNSIFLDSLSVDIERLERINRTVKLIPPEKMSESTSCARSRCCSSRPRSRSSASPRASSTSCRDGALRAAAHRRPQPLGLNLASYLLFEESFCRALIDLGYKDTVAREAEVREFFGLEENRAHG